MKFPVEDAIAYLAAQSGFAPDVVRKWLYDGGRVKDGHVKRFGHAHRSLMELRHCLPIVQTVGEISTEAPQPGTQPLTEIGGDAGGNPKRSRK